jgi:uroporphyrinogen-III synthase
MAALGGAKVGVLEGRSPAMLADLIRRQGGVPVIAPALREETVAAPEEVTRLIDALSAGEIQYVVFLTGVGALALFEQAEAAGRLPELLSGLRRVTNVCRGQKPWKPLKDREVPIGVTVPSPYTTSDVLRTLEALPLAGKGVALLHYGERSDALAGAVTAAGGRLLELCLYEWRLPEDTRPLERLIDSLISNELDALVFTTQVQVRHLLQVAAASGKATALLEALRGPIIVTAVGPTTAAALEAAGIDVQVTPGNPKMGPMISALAAKLGSSPTPE